jgi:hypothetical protein
MIIGLTGYARSGKDTVANILIEEYGFTRLAFADKIRDLLVEVNPILSDGHRLNEILKDYGWEVAKAKTEVRRLLQDLGVGARKVFGDNHWIVEAFKDIDRSKNYVVTDVRFENEAEFIKSFSGQIWRIKRPGIEAVNAHVSESELDGYKSDQIFMNNGTIDDLTALVKTRMTGLL